MHKRMLVNLFLITLFVTACGKDAETETQRRTPTAGSIDATNTPEVTETVPPPSTQEVQPTQTPQNTTGVDPSEAILLGYYPRGIVQNTVDEILSFDDWLAITDKRVSIAATFMNFNDPNLETLVPAELDAAWRNGYIAFVNLNVGDHSAKEIADGELDGRIRQWAQAYASWAQDGNKRAFIAPLQEMNGYWVSYGMDPVNFRLAYKRIQEIFYGEGVDPKSVSWVFAPNGWSPEGHEFENYYPGDNSVDVVGFSSFNFGNCSSYQKWEEYEDIYKPYIDRMYKMAPDKPIFIAEIGTVAQGGDKNQWLVDTYHKLAEEPNVQGILYFNRSEIGSSLDSCLHGADYRVYDYQSRVGNKGFLEAVSIPEIVYFPPDSPMMSEIMYNRP